MGKLLLGAESDDSGSTNHNKDYLYLSKFVAVASGNVELIKIKSAANGNVMVAIYADNAGSPGSLLNSKH